MLTVKEVAARLKVSVATVYNLVAQGKLACHRIGTGRGAVRVSEDQLRSFLERTEQKTAGAEPRRPAPRVKLNHLRA